MEENTAPHKEMPLKCQLSKQLNSSWLVFIGICGITPREGKNSGVLSTGNLSNRHQGSFSSHIQDQERNIEELEMTRTENLLSRQKPQLSILPLKVIVPTVCSLDFGGKRTGCRAQQLWLQSLFSFYLLFKVDRD